ncbi:MAG: GNAT family N-acetyltransferase [Nanoarchaeota archaeon]|nr:GNAT family N-acetyltransferase [Nanoarchaeota archaeon]
MKFVVRKAKIKDIPEITKMWKQFMKDHDDTVIPKDPRMKPQLKRPQTAHNTFSKFLAKNIRSKDATVFVLDCSGTLIGYAIGFKKKTPPVFKMKEIGYLSDIYIKRGYRSKGLGSKMIDELREWCKNKGLKYLSLIVYEKNPRAQKLYSRKGFYFHSREMRMKV